jgi:hypothetical protein
MIISSSTQDVCGACFLKVLFHSVRRFLSALLSWMSAAAMAVAATCKATALIATGRPMKAASSKSPAWPFLRILQAFAQAHTCTIHW